MCAAQYWADTGKNHPLYHASVANPPNSNVDLKKVYYIFFFCKNYGSGRQNNSNPPHCQISCNIFAGFNPMYQWEQHFLAHTDVLFLGKASVWPAVGWHPAEPACGSVQPGRGRGAGRHPSKPAQQEWDCAHQALHSHRGCELHQHQGTVKTPSFLTAPGLPILVAGASASAPAKATGTNIKNLKYLIFMIIFYLIYHLKE